MKLLSHLVGEITSVGDTLSVSSKEKNQNKASLFEAISRYFPFLGLTGNRY